VLLRPEPDRPENRLNDGCVGPDGSLCFGSMDSGESEPTGRFYRWSRSGLAGFGRPAVVTNGPAIDATRGLLYATDTVARRVSRHRLGPEGIPGPAEPFVVFGEGEGHPDGMTVDAEGHVWIAHWGGSRVTRFAPDGRPVLVVPIPTAQVTKPAFGGPDLATLYVTTAARGRDRETDPMAGHVFAFDIGIRGCPAELCRVAG
jgi:sugar lactone lactonase YvrE